MLQWSRMGSLPGSDVTRPHFVRLLPLDIVTRHIEQKQLSLINAIATTEKGR